MPDRYGFDHLPDQGRIFHRCIEEDCGWPGFDKFVSEADRRRHHHGHVKPIERQRQKEIEKTRLRNLAKARAARQQKEDDE